MRALAASAGRGHLARSIMLFSMASDDSLAMSLASNPHRRFPKLRISLSSMVEAPQRSVTVFVSSLNCGEIRVQSEIAMSEFIDARCTLVSEVLHSYCLQQLWWYAHFLASTHHIFHAKPLQSLNILHLEYVGCCIAHTETSCWHHRTVQHWNDCVSAWIFMQRATEYWCYIGMLWMKASRRVTYDKCFRKGAIWETLASLVAEAVAELENTTLCTLEARALVCWPWRKKQWWAEWRRRFSKMMHEACRSTQRLPVPHPYHSHRTWGCPW